MKAKLEGDRKKRQLLIIYEEKRRQLRKNILIEKNPVEKEQLKKKFRKFPRNSSSTRVNNRCIITGRSRGVFRHFKLSRIEIRRKGSIGIIPGLRKASWLFLRTLMAELVDAIDSKPI